MKKLVTLLFLFLSVLTSEATVEHLPLEGAPRISVLTYTPSDQVYAMYGHTSVRVQIPATSQDLLFNYGLFDFSSDDFLFRFVKGETDYRLGAYETAFLYDEAARSGISVYEQVLNLTDEQSQRLCALLFENLRPENATYRYSFLFDNCSTRPLTMLKKSVPDSLFLPPPMGTHPSTFRDEIHHCVGAATWIQFGIDIVLGGRIDIPMQGEEPLFLPHHLKEYLSKATIVHDGVQQPLCQREGWLIENPPLSVAETPFYLRPEFIFGVLLLLTLLLILWECKHHKHALWFDVLLFVLTGLAGCVVFFLTFFSEHPAVSPNWVALWLSPLHLVLALLLPFFRRRIGYFVGILNVLLCVSFYIISPFSQQLFPLSLYIIELILLSRALFFLLHYRTKRV